MKSKKNPENKLHVKTGDRVVIISGKDKGLVGYIKKAMPKLNKVIVEGANMIIKAMKPNQVAGFQGGLVKKEAPLYSSKVMIYCPKCNKGTRTTYKILENNKKTRVCIKCSEQFDIK